MIAKIRVFFFGVGQIGAAWREFSAKFKAAQKRHAYLTRARHESLTRGGPPPKKKFQNRRWEKHSQDKRVYAKKNYENNISIFGVKLCNRIERVPSTATRERITESLLLYNICENKLYNANIARRICSKFTLLRIIIFVYYYKSTVFNLQLTNLFDTLSVDGFWSEAFEVIFHPSNAR